MNFKRSPIIIVLALVVCFVWLAVRLAEGGEVEYHHARSAIAIAYHLDSDSTDSEICPACNGAGEVGDGVIMHKCEECDGTGKIRTGEFVEIEPEPVIELESETVEPPAEPEPVIELPKPIEVEWSESQPATTNNRRFVLITEDWCAPCKTMKANLKAAGVEVEEVTRQQAVDQGLVDSIVPIPRLVNSANKTDTLNGAWSVDGIRKWQARQPQPAKAEPIVTATIHSEPSAAATLAALAEHLARTQDASAVPVGGLFDTDVQAPVIVPELLSQLMAGETISVPDSGISAVWTGEKRSITFESKDTVALTPPLSVKLSKWGLSVNTILRGCTVADAGRTVQFDLKGPDFTVRFVP